MSNLISLSKKILLNMEKRGIKKGEKDKLHEDMKCLVVSLTGISSQFGGRK